MQAMNAMEVRIFWWWDALLDEDMSDPVMQLELLRFVGATAEKVTAQPDVHLMVKASAAAVFSACRAASVVVREGLDGDVEPTSQLASLVPMTIVSLRWRDVFDVRAFHYVMMMAAGEVGSGPHWWLVRAALQAFDSVCVTAFSGEEPGERVNEDVLEEVWAIV